ncbi:hypothetical protein F9C07_13418 [Aspergillus flavus]|uniref:Thioesterase domain-containing protein n=1 Tax=Aspergillus flavus (strain ATCC 200026 / FGSC A1120 / IAM 13836 / NRRL 3357 / JCM 12722 / SRRC 167) TaxID=332952 RepID=A0A7U2MY92_ASPFN|nr:hypothetical protein F9C07_13418 [Aspergillus flavus]
MTALRFVRSVSLGVLSGYIGAGASLRVTAAKPGLVNFELDIQKEHTNRLNILHGGTIASMVTYLSSGGKVGDKILAEASCDKFGKTLAYTSIKFINSKGEIVARGSHTKYIALAWKDPQNIVEELGGRQS